MFFLFSKSIPQNPSANRDPQVSKAVYKFNRSITKAGLIPTRDLRRTRDQIDFLKGLLGKKWKWSYLDKEQAAIIKAILFVVETMPINGNGSDSDNGYFRILLPMLNETIHNLRREKLRGFVKKEIEALDMLKQMFLARLSLGFGKEKQEGISAHALSLLARQKDIRSIQNAVSAKKLETIKGKTNSHLICSISARAWLTKSIKSRLMPIKNRNQINDINTYINLEYLNFFEGFSLNLALDRIELLSSVHGPAVYQFIDKQTKETIYTGYSKNLLQRIKVHFSKINFAEECSLCIHKPKTRDSTKAVEHCRSLEHFLIRNGDGIDFKKREMKRFIISDKDEIGEELESDEQKRA